MVLTKHHLFWPKNDYRTETELAFRALPCYHVSIGVEVHRVLHAHSKPPTKPSTHVMNFAIQRHGSRGCGCS